MINISNVHSYSEHEENNITAIGWLARLNATAMIYKSLDDFSTLFFILHGWLTFSLFQSVLSSLVYFFLQCLQPGASASHIRRLRLFDVIGIILFNQ